MKISIVSCFEGGGKHVVGLLARFLKKYFEKMNVECDYVSWRTLLSQERWLEYEHLLSIDKVGFTEQSKNDTVRKKIDTLRKDIKGELCAIEHLIYSRDRFVEDRVFVTLPNTVTIPHTQISYMGWAAEPEYCFPESKEFVFIDHPYYKQRRGYDDHSYAFKNCCSELKIKALFLDNNGVSEVVHNQYTKTLFDRSKNIPWEEIVPFYRKATVFVVTHKERLGWSIIEATMSGAAILAPRGTVNEILLNDVPHILIDNMNDIQEVKEKILEAINLGDSMKKTGYKERDNLIHNYTWENLCNRIVVALKNPQKVQT